MIATITNGKSNAPKGPFCPVCDITVAPNDPDKVVRGEHTYHGYCFKRFKAMVADLTKTT